MKRWTQTPKGRIYKQAYDREWRAKPENKAKRKKFDKERYLRKKANEFHVDLFKDRKLRDLR
jgi:hypothetical protein